MYTNEECDFHIPDHLPGAYWIHSGYYKRELAEQALVDIRRKLTNEYTTLTKYYEATMPDDPLDHPDFDRLNTRLCQLGDMLNLQIIEQPIENYQI